MPVFPYILVRTVPSGATIMLAPQTSDVSSKLTDERMTYAFVLYAAKRHMISEAEWVSLRWSEHPIITSGSSRAIIGNAS